MHGILPCIAAAVGLQRRENVQQGPTKAAYERRRPACIALEPGFDGKRSNIPIYPDTNILGLPGDDRSQLGFLGPPVKSLRSAQTVHGRWTQHERKTRACKRVVARHHHGSIR